MKKWFKSKLKNEKGESSASGGISFAGALFILFLGLKLTKVITWSWWWVSAPLWIPFAIILPFLLLYLIFS